MQARALAIYITSTSSWISVVVGGFHEAAGGCSYIFEVHSSVGLQVHIMRSNPIIFLARRPCSTQAEPLSRKAVLDDPFFVTGGGPYDTAVRSEECPSPRRPQSTPLPLGRRAERRRGLPAPLIAPARRVMTADTSSLGFRLRFRPDPIQNFVSAALRNIDPTGVFNTYQEWSDVKNRVLSSE